jgi:hypothetical protein
VSKLVPAVEACFARLSRLRRTGSVTGETSYYAALEELLNAIGGDLKPKVFCLSQLTNLGAGRQDLQKFAGSLEGFGATKGVFVTTSSFAAPAREFAGRISKRIILIDGAELAKLMVENNVGVRIRTSYEVKRIDEDYFGET